MSPHAHRRKRHLLVDTLGPLMAVLVTGAGLDDGAAAARLLVQVSTEDFPRFTPSFGDNKYNNHSLDDWLVSKRPGWQIEVKSRPEEAKGFVPLRKRWVVERTNAWNGRARRNSNDYERLPESSAAMIQLSAVDIVLNRIAPKPSTPRFNYRLVRADA